ncbi:Plakophilin-2 [Plecturocebus cupreus]
MPGAFINSSPSHINCKRPLSQWADWLHCMKMTHVKWRSQQGAVAHVCNPSTLGGQGGRITRSGVRNQHGETLFLLKIQKLASRNIPENVFPTPTPRCPPGSGFLPLRLALQRLPHHLVVLARPSMLFPGPVLAGVGVRRECPSGGLKINELYPIYKLDQT